MPDFHYPMVKMEGPDDPDRCHGITAVGQCQHKRLPPSKFCSKHGGAHTQKSIEKEKIRMYKLLQWQQRAGEFAGAEKIKTLRDEIGIARFTLETVLNKCEDANALLVYNSNINQSLTLIKTLIEATQKLEEKGELLLDREQLMVMADSIVQVINKHVSDASVRDIMAEEIADVLETTIFKQDKARAEKVSRDKSESMGGTVSHNGNSVSG